jgi:hypothetical protein
MKKFLLLVLFVPLVSFSQNETRNNNGLQNLLKQAEKIVGNIDFNKKSVETSDSDTEKLIINLWKNYSKAFEYKDYNKVASFFTFPATFGISSTPTTFNYKAELIDRYKLIREVNMQEGYKYSLLDDYEFFQLSQNTCVVKATYSRYNTDYNKIYTGQGLYFYKRINNSWKLYAIDSIQ